MSLLSMSIKKIAIFRALQLGDMLCAIPAIRALHEYVPDAQITLLGLPWASWLKERFPSYIQETVSFPGFPGLPEQPFDARRFHMFIGDMIDRQFDLVLQMQGNGTIVNPMVELFNARTTAGYYLPGDYAPNMDLYIPYPEGIHESERHLRLMEKLGATSLSTDLEFPLFAQDKLEIEALQLVDKGDPYVCVHPGSRGSWRQWPTAYFAALADKCVENGRKVILTGTGDEMLIINEVKSQMKYHPQVAAGKTSLGAIGALIKDADALISNCTGVSHIAAALKTPSLVISMDGEPERWAPLNHDIHYTIDWTRTTEYQLAERKLEDLLRKQSQRSKFGDRVTVTT